MAQLLDVDDLCLEKICENLNLFDLLNVADTNQRLRSIARIVFRREYSTEEINLEQFINFRLDEPFSLLKVSQNGTCSSGNQEDVCALKVTLQFLRCFGSFLKNLVIEYTNSSAKNRTLIGRYINHFCSTSLVKIKFYHIEESDFLIDRPFSAVEVIEFIGCRIGKELSQFQRLFPKMRRLSLFRCKLAKPIYIVNHFPHLTDLSFSEHWETSYAENVVASLRLNPQLKRLELGTFFKDARFLQYISKYLQNLESIKISWDLDQVYNLKNTNITFGNVKEFKLCVYGNKPLPKLPFSFKKLEAFTLMTSGTNLNDNVMEFMAKHKTITRLVLIGLKDVLRISSELRTQIAQTLPGLERIYFVNYEMSVQEVDQFLAKFKSLQTFLFTLDDGSKANLNYLNWFMGHQWQICTVSSSRRTNPEIKLKRNILN